MFKDSHAFSSFSVDNVDAARNFYRGVLGLDVRDDMGALTMDLAGGGRVFAYPKGSGHEPATFTVLNFPVADVDAAVAELKEKGVKIEHYDNELATTDTNGIARGTPTIAWFKDPAGNILSVIEDKRAAAPRGAAE